MLIDPKSPTPIFRQIAAQLRESIKAGVYKARERLPSIRALAVDIKVNPNTVQRAYDGLEREGIVESRRGVGVFVTNAKLSTLGAAQRQLTERLLRCIKQGGVTPEGVRSAFESALRMYVDGAKR